MKVGHRGKAGPHAAYIGRVGRYAARLERSEERLAGSGNGNLPAWAGGNPAVLWKASDTFERANGTTYREMELALPRELNDVGRQELVRTFVAAELGTRHAYQWAIHVPKASDGLEQPHAHLMFSERQMDGIERDPEQHFKRYKAQAPEQGGARKQFGRETKPAERKAELVALRARWEETVNRALEEAGLSVRIDMRSLKAQAEERGLPRGLAPAPETRTLPSRWHRNGGSEAMQAVRAERPTSMQVIDDRIAAVVHVEGLDAEVLRAAQEAREASEAVARETVVAARKAGEVQAAAEAARQIEARRQAECREAQRREAARQERARRAAQKREEARRAKEDEQVQAIEAERAAKAVALEQLDAAVLARAERLSAGALAPEREELVNLILERVQPRESASMSRSAADIETVVRSLGEYVPARKDLEKAARWELGALTRRRAMLGEAMPPSAIQDEAERDEVLARARGAEAYAANRERDYAQHRDRFEREAHAWGGQHPIRAFFGLTRSRDALLGRSASAEASMQEEARLRLELHTDRLREEDRVYGPLQVQQVALAEAIDAITDRQRVLARRIEQLMPVKEQVHQAEPVRKPTRQVGADKGQEQGRRRGSRGDDHELEP